MDKLFLDTDVILDFLLDRDDFSEASVFLLTLGDMGKITLFSSGLVFSNCYYILRKISSHSKAIDALQSLASFIQFTTIDHQVVQDALHSSFKDFENALQNSSATFSGLKVLITRNGKDYRKSKIAVMTPEEYISRYTAII
ncbi:MAG TPA: PIN domain-containing protein [Saprospiraceae bacterium]